MLGMKPRVKKINICALLLSHFICVMMASLETAFTSYLLKANYHIYGDETAEVAGNLGFVGDIGSIIMVVIAGPAMDIFGRKAISIIGLAVASGAMFSKPLLGGLTGLYIVKFVGSMGTVPLMHSPYPTDYV